MRATRRWIARWIEAGAAAAWLAAAAGCSDEPEPPDVPIGKCTLPFLGEQGAEVKIETTVLDSASAQRPLEDGATVDIVTPPQGGRVIFAGVRATNLDPCAVELTGALRDVATNQLMSDTRTINLRPGSDGWGTSVETDIASFANVPVCPNQWSATDIFGAEYELVVQLRTRDRSVSVQKTVKVRPACNEPALEKECRCICKTGYVLGESCE